MTIAEVLVPASRRGPALSRGAIEGALVFSGSAIVALSAQFTFWLPFTSVPITGQTFAVLLVGTTLGSRRGALAMALYLAEGAMGLPVFAHGGLVGFAHLVGPTGGYLWSYPLAAWVVGRLAESGWDRRPVTAGLAMLMGNAVIYLVGLPWLALFFVGWDQVLMAGLLPYVPGDLVKIVLAAMSLPTAWAVIGRVRGETGGQGP